MRYQLVTALSVSILFAGRARGEDTTPDARAITLPEAVAHARAHSPTLAASALQVSADKARLRGNPGVQNPALSVEAEDFLGSGVAHGADALQMTWSLSQDVPLGGRPGAIRKVNEATREVSTIDYKIVEQQLVAEVAATFLNVLAHQRRRVNADEMVSLAEQTVAAIEAQVEAGRATPIEVDKAAVVRSLALLDRDRVERELIAAKQHLASICGEETPFFDTAVGTLDNIAPLPDLTALLDRVASHPLLLTKAAEVRRQRAVITLEKARRIPDLSVALGYRYLNATRDSAVVAGVAMPLPVADRNQGGIGAAARTALKFEQAADAARLALHRELRNAYQMLATEHRRASVLKRDVYPKVLATYEAIAEGYRIGRFGYLDLLDAQRTLFEVKEQTLEALVAYQRTAIHLDHTAALPVSATRFEVGTDKGGDPK